MRQIAWSDEKGIARSIIRFAQFARRNGLNVGVQETMDALQAATTGIFADRDAWHYGLRSIFCCEADELPLFDQLFDQFWKLRKPIKTGTITIKGPVGAKQNKRATLVMLGEGETRSPSEAAKNMAGANSMEQLRKTDFSKVTEVESTYLEEIAYRLWKQMSLRMKRRMRASRKKTELNLRQIIRQSLSSGGEPLELSWKGRKPRRHRLIVILDVSGSMDKYSFYLLRFICVLKAYFQKVDAFIFSTRIVRITDILEARNLALTLNQLSAQANNWSGGTRIGECFKIFNEQYAKRLLNGRSTVIILSDGLDTGDPMVLEKEITKIKNRTSQLIWLNPLKGTRDYQPLARGMRAALPQLDRFQSAHNLDSLLELEDYLSVV